MPKEKKCCAGVCLTIALLIVIGIFAVIVYSYATNMSALSSKQYVFTNVSGSANVSAAPDVLTVDVEVQSINLSADVAQNMTSTKVENLTSALNLAGIPSFQIQTTYYSVNPYQIYQNSSFVNEGYQATQDLQIATNSSQTAALVASISLRSGGNGTSVTGIYSSLSNPLQRSLETEALSNAVLLAKSKAGVIANATGLRVVRLVSITETQPQFIYPLPLVEGGLVSSNSKTQAPVRITPTNVVVSAQVQAEYELG